MRFDEWFLNEFGKYGFTLTPIVVNPYNFMPLKKVIDPSGKCTNIKLTLELSDDLHAFGMTYDHHVEALRELIRMEVRRLYPQFLKPTAEPVKYLTPFKF
jgi:hypothetical protein